MSKERRRSEREVWNRRLKQTSIDFHGTWNGLNRQFSCKDERISQRENKPDPQWEESVWGLEPRQVLGADLASPRFHCQNRGFLLTSVERVLAKTEA
jgi:hypothetical protein